MGAVAALNGMKASARGGKPRPRSDLPDEVAASRDERGRTRPRAEIGVEVADSRHASVAQAIARVARGQRSVLRLDQLVAAGLGEDAVAYRARTGAYRRMFTGVYLVDYSMPAGALEMAAVLACGEDTVTSHASAGAIWAPKVIDAPAMPEVTTTRRLHSRAGITMHRARRLEPIDIRILDGLRVTSPARTVLDLAAVGHPSLEAVFGEMLARRVLREPELAAALERARKRRGVALVRSLLGANRRGFTRSEAERRLQRLCRTGGLPAPVSNVRIAGYEVDFMWPEQRLVVEVDGFQFHGHRAAFERDRRRDQVLMTAGYRVLRVTWRQLVDEPLAVLVVIASALSSGPSPSRDAH